MEQSTQTNNYERLKQKVCRPKGTGLLTDEENKERARMRSRPYYSSDIEKEKDRKRLEYQATNSVSNDIFQVLFFHVPFKQMAT